MSSVNVLKVDYFDGLRFKHLDEQTGATKVDISLDLTESDSKRLLKSIREVLRGDCEGGLGDFGKYEITLKKGTELSREGFTIGIMERSGEGSRVLGTFQYNKILGNPYMLDGITKAISSFDD